MRAAVTPCVAAIRACNNAGSGVNSTACLGAMDICNLGLIEPVQLKGMNLYDLRMKCEHPPLCYDFSQVDKFLNDPDTQTAIGVHRKWQECSHAVNIGFAFAGDWMHEFQQKLPEQLAAGIRVLIYAGDQDYICNWLGNKAWTLAMEWPGKSAFNAAKDAPWAVAGEEAGMVRSAQNFTFLQVYQAGHMVPMDQPKNALQMLNSFVAGTGMGQDLHCEGDICAF